MNTLFICPTILKPFLYNAAINKVLFRTKYVIGIIIFSLSFHIHAYELNCSSSNLNTSEKTICNDP